MSTTIVLLGGAARTAAAARHVRATAWRMGFDTLVEATLPSRELEKMERRVAPNPLGWLRIGTGECSTVDILVLYDALPNPPLTHHQKKYAGIDNGRVAQLWERLHFSLPPRISGHPWTFSILPNSHSTNAFADLAFGSTFTISMKERIEASNGFRHPPGVIEPLSILGERARVDLVNHDGRVAVRKMFRPGRQRYFGRELFALTELSRDIPQIPRLLDHGADYVVMERYEDQLRLDGHRLNVARRLISLDVADSMIAIIRAFYDHGYSLLDCHPGHFLFGPRGEVRVIDFEFLHQYESKPQRFEECFDFAGVLYDIDELDIPSVLNKAPYEHYWLPHLGLQLEDMLHGSQLQRRIGRVTFRTRRNALRIARPAVRRIRRAGRLRHRAVAWSSL